MKGKEEEEEREKEEIWNQGREERNVTILRRGEDSPRRCFSSSATGRITYPRTPCTKDTINLEVRRERGEERGDRREEIWKRKEDKAGTGIGVGVGEGGGVAGVHEAAPVVASWEQVSGEEQGLSFAQMSYLSLLPREGGGWGEEGIWIGEKWRGRVEIKVKRNRE